MRAVGPNVGANCWCNKGESMSICRMIRSQIARLAVLGLAMLAPFSGASADDLKVIPAEKFVTAPGGVDMRTGRFVYSQTDLAAGSDANGIMLNRTMPDYAARHINPFANFSHNWDIWLVESRISISTGQTWGGPDYRMNVHIGGRSITFDSPASFGNFQYKGDGLNPILEASGDRALASTIYTLRDADGTVMTFRPIGAVATADCAGNQSSSVNPASYASKRCAYISSLTRPDGTRFDFSYENTGVANGNAVRLARVSSSRGFVLILEGTGSNVTKSCVFNASRLTPPSANTCPAGALATTYGYITYGTPASPRLASVTDAAGSQWAFSYTNLGMGFIKPGQTTPWLTNALGSQVDEEGDPQEIVTSQNFADGSSYTYAYNVTPLTNSRPIPMIMGGTFTDSFGKSVSIEYDFPIQPGTRMQPCQNFPCNNVPADDYLNWVYQSTPGPTRITDQIGRTTNFNYCDPVAAASMPSWQMDRCVVLPLIDTTDPEGIKSDFKYDGNGNTSEVRRHAKPGSGIADTVVSATFNCADRASCAKPVTATDALGKVTDRTYASGHGGALTEMLPAPASGGARPLKVFTYSQRYPWAYNSSGILVQAASPVWVPATETQCQTAAGSSTPTCDSGAQQTVKTYEYGTAGTADALLVKGVAVSSAGVTLRTCYSYDAFGRKLSETLPNANLSSCP